MTPACIVLIEDNEADALLIRMALKESGIPHELTWFGNGKEAIENLCKSEAAVSPDAILLDLNMPLMGGFEVLDCLAQDPNLAQVPTVVLTSSPSRFDRHEAAKYGVRFVQKPSQLDSFLSTMGETVASMLAAGKRE